MVDGPENALSSLGGDVLRDIAQILGVRERRTLRSVNRTLWTGLPSDVYLPLGRKLMRRERLQELYFAVNSVTFCLDDWRPRSLECELANSRDRYHVEEGWCDQQSIRQFHLLYRDHGRRGAPDLAPGDWERMFWHVRGGNLHTLNVELWSVPSFFVEMSNFLADALRMCVRMKRVRLHLLHRGLVVPELWDAVSDCEDLLYLDVHVNRSLVRHLGQRSLSAQELRLLNHDAGLITDDVSFWMPIVRNPTIQRLTIEDWARDPGPSETRRPLISDDEYPPDRTVWISRSSGEVLRRWWFLIGGCREIHLQIIVRDYQGEESKLWEGLDVFQGLPGWDPSRVDLWYHVYVAGVDTEHLRYRIVQRFTPLPDRPYHLTVDGIDQEEKWNDTVQGKYFVG